jgi:hypothetical protein
MKRRQAKALMQPMVKRSRTKFPGLERRSRIREQTAEMCLIHRDFKHFARPKAINFASFCNVPSIMRAKLLSIMRPEGWPLRRD